MSNSLDPDQAQHYVGPDLDQNCLQMLSADDKFCDIFPNFRKTRGPEGPEVLT